MSLEDDRLNGELDQIALSVSSNESNPDVLALACLAHISRQALACSFAQSDGSVVSPLIELGDRCLFHYLDHLGIPRQRLQKALQALDQATSVYHYLRQLPD